MSKILIYVVSFCLVIISVSVWYYFLVLLPWIENQKLVILNRNEERKQKTLQNLDECIKYADERYTKNWNISCEYHAKAIESCKWSIEDNYKFCIKSAQNEYDQCKITKTYWFIPEDDIKRVNAYCQKRECKKIACDEYKEQSWQCLLPQPDITVLDNQKSSDILRCKEKYTVDIGSYDSDTVIKQEQVIKIQK